MRQMLAPLMVSGALGMVFSVGISSPATTDFFRAVGASEFHFGLIGGIPMTMLLMQFVGAAVLNRVCHRKGIYVATTVASRLLYLCLAFVPLVLRDIAPAAVMPLVIILLAVIAGSSQFASPFVYSWLADLIPKRVTNRVWGRRSSVSFVAWTLAYLSVTFVLYALKWPPTKTFPLLVTVAVTAGLADILLLSKLPEPPNVIDRNSNLWRDLVEPARHPSFGRFIVFACFWNFALQFGSGFLFLYCLKELHMPPFMVMLCWSLQGLGTALTSSMWGRLTDRYGHRPVLKVCVAYKPVLFLGFLFITPENVVWLLPLLLLPDGMVNGGYTLAIQGYMLTMSPQRNRSMFIAAQTGLAGICGGLSMMVAGALLESTKSLHVNVFGMSWGHYHLIFFICMALRMASLWFAQRIHEPGAVRARVLLRTMVEEGPVRALLFPVGLFRNWRPGDDDESGD